MADKFVTLDANARRSLREATVVSTGLAEAGDVVALDANGKLDNSVLPTGIGADTKNLEAFEALNAGDFVNIFLDTGTPKIRKADATTSGKEADGFVLAAVAAAANGDVYFEGTNNQMTGLTIGDRYYLNTTAGGVTTTPPVASGNVVQYLGRAISATEIAFEADVGVIVE